MRRAGGVLLLLVVGLAPAAADARPLALPAGTLGAAVTALGRQTGESVAVADPALWRRPVPAISGDMDAAAALRRLLAGSGARALRTAGGWRIVAAPPPVPRTVPRPAPAPAAEMPVVEEPVPIVVVASKRSALLQGFPGTVTRIEGDGLALGGEGGAEALLQRIATVSSTHLGTGRNKLFIRGIADSSFTGPTQATVGQYAGDVRLTYNAPDPDLRLYDIAAVEVLEGPQGTLYGAGSLAGIVRLVRNMPDPSGAGGWSGAGLSLTAHGAPSADLGAVANLPLGRGAALRLSGYRVMEGGYIDDTARGLRDINRVDVAGGRAAVRIGAGGGWTVDAGLTAQHSDGRDSQYADRGARPLTRASRLAQPFRARYGLGEIVVAGPVGALDFVSSTGVVRQRLDERFDATPADGALRVFAQRNETDMISVENRLSKPMSGDVGWVVGTSLLHNRTRLVRALGEPGRPLPATGVDNAITEATLYGEATVRLFPGLTATGGARYSHALVSGEGEDVTIAAMRAGSGITAGRREDALLPSLALAATPVDRVTLFARYQQGFRPGGLAVQGDYVQRFASDRTETMELGLRRGAAGVDRWDLAVSLSHTRWQDIQADFVDGAGLPSTANIGDGRIHSLSVAAGVQATDDLRLEAGLAVNDSRVTEPNRALLAMLSLERVRNIPNIADVVARGEARWERALAGDRRLSLSASLRYTGRSRLGLGPLLGDLQGDYLDSRLVARLDAGDVSVVASMTNVADVVGNRFALGTPFAVGQPGQVTPLRPRTVRIGVETRF